MKGKVKRERAKTEISALPLSRQARSITTTRIERKLYANTYAPLSILNEVAHIIINSVVSSAILSLVLGFLFHRRTTRITEQIKLEFERSKLAFQSRRLWKEESVAKLLGKLYLHFDRTRRAFERYDSRNLYLEAKVLKDGNTAIRDLMLQQAHLIPPPLLEDAGKLLEHYDRWLEEFERVRSDQAPDLNTPFVFVGPKGFPFPRESEKKFTSAFHDLWGELYGINNP